MQPRRFFRRKTAEDDEPKIPHFINYTNAILGILGFFVTLMFSCWGIRLTKEANSNHEQIDTLSQIVKELRGQSKNQFDLLKSQDTSNKKQDSLINKIATLVTKQDTQISLTKGEIRTLRNLAEYSTQLNEIGNRQYEKLTDVLKSIQNSYYLMNISFTVDKRQSFYSLYDSVTRFSKYDQIFTISYEQVRTAHQKGGALELSGLHYSSLSSFSQKLTNIQSNAYLFYDSIAQAKFLVLYTANKILENGIEILTVPTSQIGRSPEAYKAAEANKNLMQFKIWGYFTTFSSAFFDFKNYILGLRQSDRFLK